MIHDDLEFVLLAEAGVLERQALLACESLRRFGGTLSSSLITVVSPRPDLRPSRDGVRRLERMQVQYMAADIASSTPEMGESYKPLALALVESRPGPRTLVQVDSDTVFVDEPSALAIATGVVARPVDAAGLCTTGPDHRLDPFWRALCKRFGVDYERLPFVRTTLGDIRVKANYNGGLIACAREHQVFQQAATFFRAAVVDGLFPPGRDQLTIRTGAGMVSGAAARYFGMSQVALSLACAALDIEVRILPAGYNFPVHGLEHGGMLAPASLTHLHYHWLAGLPADDAHPLLGAKLGLAPRISEWLRQRLPL